MQKKECDTIVSDISLPFHGDVGQGGMVSVCCRSCDVVSPCGCNPS